MSRLIDADAMLKRNEHSIYDTTDLKEMLDNEPTVNQWIPCSDRLPETSYVGGRSEYVQGTCEGYYIPIPVIYDGKNDRWITFGEKKVDVIAWQQLPKTFKEADIK